MVKVYERGGFRIFLYHPPREHQPPHVHVECMDGGEVVVRIGAGSMTHKTHRPEDGFLRENEAALAEATTSEGVEPRARTATYVHDLDLVLVILQNGDAFGFPPSRLSGLRDASAERLREIRISPSGDGLHWDSLDVHASLTGMIREGLRLRAWAPRILGGVSTEAKARAARANGRKGGRPKRETAR